MYSERFISSIFSEALTFMSIIKRVIQQFPFVTHPSLCSTENKPRHLFLAKKKKLLEKKSDEFSKTTQCEREFCFFFYLSHQTVVLIIVLVDSRSDSKKERGGEVKEKLFCKFSAH